MRRPKRLSIAAAIHVDAEAPAQVIAVAEAGLVHAPDDPNLLYLLGLAYMFENKPAQSLHT